MIDVIINILTDTGSFSTKFITNIKRIPNIGEAFEYISQNGLFYYGEVTRVETSKNDKTNEEKVYINVKLFKTN